MSSGQSGRAGLVQEGGGVDDGGEMEESAYRRTVGELGRQLRAAELDHSAFARPLRRCELARCRATCCHDGVVVGGEEIEEIAAVVEARAEWFEKSGWGTDGRLFEEGAGRWKTATRPAREGELADDFPAHFARTRCVFLDAGHCCVLQRLSVEEGKHPWHWKPVSCWMHPLILRPARRGGEGPVLTVLSPDEDFERFASCTHCGRPDAGGEPARDVLVEELRMLQAIAGRDFAGELAAGE